MRQLLVLFYLLSSVVIFHIEICAQQNNDDKSQTNRKVFSSFTIGAIEILSLSIGYQIDDNYSIAIKSQNIASGGGWIFPATSWGVGLAGSYYFVGSIFNSAKVSFIPLYKTDYQFEPKEFIKGFSFECTVNREKIFSHLFRFYYELGLAYCKVKNRDALFAPSIKIGIIYNF
jgi:hypothetical protein